MRLTGLFALFFCAVTACAQQAIPLPTPPTQTGPAADSFRFVSDGPRALGWSRADVIPRKYFHENLPALFERTLTLDTEMPERATLRWIFTGPHAGFTVTLTADKVQIAERYYDSMALYTGEGNYPEKTVSTVERQFEGHAQSLTVVADSHLAVRVLVNGEQLIEAPLTFDVTRHQLMLAASRSAHDVVAGTLVAPEVQTATVTIDPGQIFQTMLGFGGSPSITSYDELSPAGKQQYWQMLKRYNLLISREYPMGEALKPDMSNLADPNDATPHYYGDNFPNSELTSFDYNKHIQQMGGSIIYELWALPTWATEPYHGPRVIDTWNKTVRQVANPESYARIIVEYCRKEQAATGAPPMIVGLENEVDQPPAVFDAMAVAVRKALDQAGFTQVKIHMADASYMAKGIQRALDLRKDPAAWRVIDYSATHEYDFQEFMANPDMYDARMNAMHQAAAGKPYLATEICFNDAHYQELSYRIAFQAAQLYYKNLTTLDAEAILYCWTLLDVEQPSFAGSRALMAPDRTKGWIPVPSSFELRVLGAYSRHILKGMKRVGASTSDPDLLTTAFTGEGNETLVMVNRGTAARKITVNGASHPWAEMERTGLEEPNEVSAVPDQIIVRPGEIVVLSTIKAE
ncbi:MAG TPA: hypothetical protein VGS02_09390 [Acidobacteriaceae bacterium]|nr:hypothetical protein [Acidobacteriaceae bacterium]